jgi:hypothetical protein
VSMATATPVESSSIDSTSPVSSDAGLGPSPAYAAGPSTGRAAEGPYVLDAKLARWDEYAPRTIAKLIELLVYRKDEILAVARGRHVRGHYLFGDRNYAEYDRDRLLWETIEELADAVNYTARRLYLEENDG